MRVQDVARAAAVLGQCETIEDKLKALDACAGFACRIAFKEGIISGGEWSGRRVDLPAEVRQQVLEAAKVGLRKHLQSKREELVSLGVDTSGL